MNGTEIYMLTLYVKTRFGAGRR